MSGPGWPLLVRRASVWSSPPPPGGAFAERALVRLPVPPVVTSPFGVYCVDTTRPYVALTYDDGPHPEHTPQLLDVLAARGATATFFVLARQARRHPDLVRRTVAAGHELALHGDDHTSLRSMSLRTAVARVRAARAEVEDIAGVGVRLFRPPYGAHTMPQAVALRLVGLDVVLWSSHGRDWLDDAAPTVIERVLEGVFPGGIVLLHDCRADPERLEPHERLPEFDKAAVLEGVLDGLAQRGLRTAQVSALLARDRHVRSGRVSR